VLSQEFTESLKLMQPSLEKFGLLGPLLVDTLHNTGTSYYLIVFNSFRALQLELVQDKTIKI